MLLFQQDHTVSQQSSSHQVYRPLKFMFTLQEYYLGIKLSFRSLGVLKTILTSHTLHKNQLSFRLARPKVDVKNVEIEDNRKKGGGRLGGWWREGVKCGL